MAEPTPTPEPIETPEPTSTPESTPAPEPTPEPTPAPTFSQEDVNKAVADAKKEWETQQNLNKLPDDERIKEQNRLDREQLDKDRAELDRRILEQDAADMLREKGINTKFAKQLCGKDAEETKANIDAFAEEWNKAISAGINDKLKGTPPKAGGDPPPPVDPFLQGFGN